MFYIRKSFLIVPKDINLEQEYPDLYTYLLSYEHLLKSRYDKTAYWFGLRSCSYYDFFNNIKKIWEVTADKWRFAVDTSGSYLVSNRFFLVSTKLSPYYLLGLLNSDLLHYYFIVNNGMFTYGGAYCLKEYSIGSLPIKIPTSYEEKEICDIVLEILNENVINNNNTFILEDKLNKAIYSLYNLTNDDVYEVNKTLQNYTSN